MKKTLLSIIFLLLTIPAIAGVSIHGGGTNNSWRAVIVSDIHMYTYPNYLPNTMFPDIVTDITDNIKPDLVILMGDLIAGGYSGQTKTVEEQLTTYLMPYLAPLYSAGISVYAARGNHEVCNETGTDQITGWNAAWATVGAMPTNSPVGEVGLTYAFTKNNANFVIIDQFVGVNQANDSLCGTGATTATTMNQTWINSIISANTSRHIFALGHLPMFEPSTWGTYPAIGGTTSRNTFWASLVTAHADAFIGGHAHIWDWAQITKAGDAHSVYNIIDGTGLAHTDVAMTYPSTAGRNSPYTLSEISAYHSDAVDPSTTGEALGYLLIEVHGKGNADPRVTMTWKHATWNSGTSHWTFSNYYYYQYSIDDN